MIISDEIKEKIFDVIDSHFNGILIKMGGRGALSREQIEELIQRGIYSLEIPVGLVEDAYYIGRLRPTVKLPDAVIDDIRLAKLALPMSDTENYALKYVKESVGEYVTKLQNNFKTTVSQIIGKQNLMYRNKILTEIVRPTIVSGIIKRKTVGAVASELRDKTKDMFRDWQRVAETEMTNAVNYGAYDAIVRQSEEKGEKLKDVYVAKIVVMDNALCPHCRKFFVSGDGSPKVYPLSELQANGDNYGRKAVDWKPVIGSVHPRCRCQLVHIQTGWQFEPGTQELQFVGVGKENYK